MRVHRKGRQRHVPVTVRRLGARRNAQVLLHASTSLRCPSGGNESGYLAPSALSKRAFSQRVTERLQVGDTEKDDGWEPRVRGAQMDHALSYETHPKRLK
jgi:hypothetical protein